MARKRRTSKIRRKSPENLMRLNVRTPRVIAFQTMRFFGRLGKLAMILALVGVTVWGAQKWIVGTYSKNQEFALNQIDVKPNDAAMPIQRLVDVAGIKLGCSIFDIDVKSVKERLEALPEIISVEARRKLPNELCITIVEREPIAWLECRAMQIAGRTAKSGYLFDKDGVIFPCSQSLFHQVESLPVISIGQHLSDNLVVGEQVQNGNVMRAMALAKSSLNVQSGMPRIDRITLLNSYSMEAWMSNGARALFGMHGHERQLNDLYAILSDAFDKGKRVLEVNLIPKRNIPVKYDQSASVFSEGKFLALND